MVLQRVTPLVLALALAIASATGCVRSSKTTATQPKGSCEGACEHYMKCKRSSDQTIYRACVRECVETFAEDGVQDTETLGHIELLDCEETVGFVEGAGGRPPGS